MTIYQVKGFKNRIHYIKELALEHGIPVSSVIEVANLLGKDEDFDGLVSMVQEYSGQL